MAANANHRLACFHVPMDGHHCPGLDGVEHALGLVFRGVAEVEVHAEAG